MELEGLIPEDYSYQLSSQLVVHSERLFTNYPKYILDFSWPSANLLHHYLQPYLGRQSFTKEEDYIINSCAAYLSIIAADLWHTLDPDNCEISIEGTQYEFILCARGGKLLPNRGLVRINVTKQLRNLIQNPAQPFSILGDYTVPAVDGSSIVHPQIQPASTRNLIGPFALGLFTGLSPYAEGPWKDSDSERWFDRHQDLLTILSGNTAKYYAKNFPSEPLGANPELYSAGLIYPQDSYLQAFSAYLAQLGSDPSILLENLCQSPSQRIAQGAFLALFARGKCNSKLVAIADSIQIPWEELARARTIFGTGFDWPRLLDKGLIEDAREQINFERKLGLLPLLVLDDKRFEDSRFYPLLFSIRNQDTHQAIKDLYPLLTKGESDLYLQYVNLLLASNHFEEGLAAFTAAIDIEDSSDNPENLLRVVANLSVKGAQNLGPWFDKATALLKDKKLSYPTSLVRAIAELIISGKQQQGLSLLDRVIESEPGAVIARLLRYSIYKEAKREKAAEDDFKKIMRFAPMAEPVFNQLHLARFSEFQSL